MLYQKRVPREGNTIIRDINLLHEKYLELKDKLDAAEQEIVLLKQQNAHQQRQIDSFCQGSRKAR